MASIEEEIKYEDKCKTELIKERQSSVIRLTENLIDSTSTVKSEPQSISAENLNISDIHTKNSKEFVCSKIKLEGSHEDENYPSNTKCCDSINPDPLEKLSNESQSTIINDGEMKVKNANQEANSSRNTEFLDVSPPAPSKYKLRNTKRRAGILYRQIASNKLNKVTSKYFKAHNKNNKRWIPPRSPYALVQEDLFDNPWQLLIATIFLTKTTAKKSLTQLHKFLAFYPRPEDVLKANYEDIEEYFKPLGLSTTRAHVVMRFTVEFLEKDWTYPRELYGIGKYGDDSYRMFCINEWRQVSPDDIPLTMYRNWLLENAERLGIE